MREGDGLVLQRQKNIDFFHELIFRIKIVKCSSNEEKCVGYAFHAYKHSTFLFHQLFLPLFLPYEFSQNFIHSKICFVV